MVTLKRQNICGDIAVRMLEMVEIDGSVSPRKVTVLQMTQWFLGQLPDPTAILSLIYRPTHQDPEEQPKQTHYHNVQVNITVLAYMH